MFGGPKKIIIVLLSRRLITRRQPQYRHRENEDQSPKKADATKESVPALSATSDKGFPQRPQVSPATDEMIIGFEPHRKMATYLPAKDATLTTDEGETEWRHRTKEPHAGVPPRFIPTPSPGESLTANRLQR